MTLVVGIIAKDGIVFTSDTRMTSDITSNDEVKKIFRLNDHSAIGMAGDGTLGIHFIELISEQLTFEHGIVSLVEQIREKGKNKFEEYFSHLLPEKRPSLVFLVAGYTKKQEPKIYQLNSRDNFVPRQSTTGFDSIGVPYFADYLLTRFYEKDITISNAQILGAFCIMETETQAHGVGPKINIASFSQTRNYSELKPLEINEIKSRCAALHILNKNKFYPEEITEDLPPPKQ